MNPFEENVKDVEEYFLNFEQMYPKSYDKNKVSPFTKVRIILLNGTEFESWTRNIACRIFIKKCRIL